MVEEIFRVAISAGISPIEFWELTPYLTKISIEGKIEAKLAEIWAQAALIRSKNLPNLKSFLADKKVDSKNFETRMKQAFMEHNLRYQRGNK